MGRKKNTNKNEESIKEKTLKAYKENIGKFYCSVCASGSGQPAKVMQNLRADGYDFEKVTKSQWKKTLYCPCCEKEQSHYKLLSAEPRVTEKHRCTITSEDRKRVYDITGGIDAFTGATISGDYEVDHKVPFTILDKDIEIKTLTDAEVIDNFQILTPDHNKLKDKRCQKCKKTNMRPPFLNIKYWYEGDENYKDTCVGCGWYDGVAWREKLNKRLEKEKELVEAYKKYIRFLGDEYNAVFTLAYIHGYNCSESKIELAEQLRKEIQELEEECGVNN